MAIEAQLIDKAPGDDLPYAVDFLRWAFLAGDALASGDAAGVPPGLTISSPTINGTQVRFIVSGGVANTVYRVTVTGTTIAGRDIVEYVDLFVNVPEAAVP